MQTSPQLIDVDTLLRRGALSEAATLLEVMLRSEPGNRTVLMRLADIAFAVNRTAIALNYADRLIALDGNDADALFYKAKAELALGSAPAALQLIDKLDGVLETKTAPFYLLKGNALVSQGDYAAAGEAFEAALAIDPDYAAAYNNLGHARYKSGDLPAALAAWQEYASRSPDAKDSWTQLAGISSLLGDTEEAKRHLERAVAANPGDHAAWSSLGSLYAEGWQFEKAKSCLERALTIAPDNDGYANLLGWVDNELGDTPTALAVLNPPRERPISFGRRLRHTLLLPQIYESGSDLLAWRRRYSGGLATLRAGIDEFCTLPEHVLELDQTNFLLAYQGQDDLSLQTDYAYLLRRLISRTRPDLVDRTIATKRAGKRIKVAFASSFFRECTIGHYFRSWIEDLDPKAFERTVIYTGIQPDLVTKEIGSLSDHFSLVRGTTLEVANAIRNAQPDVLIYPEIGMHSLNYLLANMRLAPIQCAAWGHPVTTGSDLIDFYFTCDKMEPDPGSRNYSEKLVRLSGIGSNYKRQKAVAADISRDTFSLPFDQHLYICPQSLFKIHPDNDSLYLDILVADRHAVIVFFQATAKKVTLSFADRISRAMSERGISPKNQIKFLPRLTPSQFRAVLSLADVVLDTVHWSGGNTSLDALAVGAPLVTLPGAYMRGRQSKAMLEIIGVPELIANDAGGYVATALRIAQDAGLKHNIRERMLASHGELFDRPEPVYELGRHLERLHETR